MGAVEKAGGAWISTVPAADADGLLRELYEHNAHTGPAFQVLTLWPEALAARADLVRAVFNAPLGSRRRELVFTLCAALIGCDFCTAWHGSGLLRAGFAEDDVAMLKRDYRRIELEPLERAMLDYAAVLTVAPWRVDESAVAALRASGWDDRGILQINQVSAFMNMVARTNRGLGVDVAGGADHSHEQQVGSLRAQLVAGPPAAEPGERKGIWIDIVSPADAEGLLRECYERRGETGMMFRALSLWPEALAARERLMRVMFDAPIGFRCRELLFTVCAALAGCDFCTAMHGRGLLRAGFDDDEVAALKRDYRRVQLGPGEREMLDYAALLTVAPWRVEEAHVTSLRAVGWDDRAILEINQLCSFINMLARSNRGLGVDAARARDRSHEPEASRLRTAIVAGDAP